MRLISITVRNYRIHAETTVVFDQGRTLVGGPNEAGKSTLLDAAHHALFTLAKTGGKVQKAMLRKSDPQPPEVEVSFECAGKIHHLHKRFAGGTKSITVLRCDDGSNWSGSDAESQLSQLLAGKSRQENGGSWSHIWVSQGDSDSDPSTEATNRKDAIVSRLQQDGAAAVMQSAFDARIASRFKSQTEDTYNSRGVAKNSDLSRAEEAATHADRELAVARETASRLEKAVADCRAAELSLKEIDKILPELTKQLADVTSNLSQASDLKHAAETLRPAAEHEEKTYQNLFDTDKAIRQLEIDSAAAVKAIAPRQREFASLEIEYSSLKEKVKAAEKHLETTRQVSHDCRLRHELARCHADMFIAQNRHSHLRAKWDGIETLKKEMGALRTTLDSLPKIPETTLNLLETQDMECTRADATLEAMATGIELITGDAMLGGTPLSSHQIQILSETSEIQIGETIIKIHPGGGNGLAKARAKVKEATANRLKTLGQLGIESFTAARQIFGQHQEKDRAIKELQARVLAMGPDDLSREISEVESQLSFLEAEIERRESTLTGWSRPKTSDEAALKIAVTLTARETAETNEMSAKAGFDALQSSLERSDNALEMLRAALRQEEDRLLEDSHRLKLWLETHGDSQQRATALEDALERKTKAALDLKAAEEQWSALQPAQLEGDKERLSRSVESQQTLKTSAGQALAAARALLTNDGTSDPEAALALAAARASSKHDHLVSVRRRAEAIRRLDQLFSEERTRLADQFTAPLAEKITGYLQCLFGPNSSARVQLENDRFGNLELIRSGESFDFQALSGGTREQLAAAVRLAMAEILASDHDGCLPLVFDDAFAWSDPSRIQSLQRMLDLAASRGLQIVVLTCTPSNYAALGAKIHLLS